MRDDRPDSSFFHRRLLLLGGLMGAMVLMLGAQLGRLTIAEGDARLDRAERALKRSTILPTHRGRILDRRGRVLAHDDPGYGVAVRYGVITGTWLDETARRRAASEAGRGAWAEMDEAQRREAAMRHRPELEAMRGRLYRALCEHGGIDEVELARRLALIMERVERTAEHVRERQREAVVARYGEEEAARVYRPEPIAEERAAHPVLERVDDDVAFSMRALELELPGMFEVTDARRRVNPWLQCTVRVDRRSLPSGLAAEAPLDVVLAGVADHVVGSMRRSYAEDVERRPLREDGPDRDLAGYRDGDLVGASGVECAYEAHLRGARGLVRRRVDSGETERVPAAPGGDLRVTLDVALQARVQAVLSPQVGLAVVQPFHQNALLPVGWPLRCAAVVLEIESGEVLALVSTPTRAEARVAEEAGTAPAWVHDAWINRPAEAIYPPGSIIKPLVLAAAVTEGALDLDQTIECTGHYFPDEPDHLRCWIYRPHYDFMTHGPLHAEDALARSCNIFFYTLGDRLGLARLTDWLRRFGLGAAPGLGLAVDMSGAPTGAARAGESGGFLMGSEEIARLGSGPQRSAAISLGIGQGPAVTWTAVQAANAYAALARGGVWRPATLVDSSASSIEGAAPSAPVDLALDRRGVRAALEGLRRAVRDGGTGHHFMNDAGAREEIFDVEGVTLWGKTGTAQAPPLRGADTNADGEIDADDEAIMGLDHAWFVGLVGPADTSLPMFAIAVIVEYAGSGGRVAGPVANQIVHALQDEGYLPVPAESPARTESPPPHEPAPPTTSPPAPEEPAG
jgi:penicillin-binding protein 2